MALTAALAVVAGWAGPAGGSGHPASGPPGAGVHVSLPSEPPPSPISWTTCPTEPDLQCGTVSVPLDYGHPDRASIVLAVTRAPSPAGAHPTGTLVFNPGGPAESGNLILPVLLGLFPASLRRQFDIVSFDPRGTGSSEPLRCGTSPSVLASADPVPTAPGRPLPGTPAFTAMAHSCQTRASALAGSLTSADNARDLDRIRQALGLSRISFYGLSYGTVLGTVYADLFPHRVDRMILDGAVDLNASLVQQAEQEAPAIEQSLHHFFASCAAQSACPLGADPEGAFRALAGSLARHPLPAPGAGDPVPVTVGDLDTATLFDLSVPGFTPTYEAALVAAVHGNGAPLRFLSLELMTDIDGSPLVDPLWATTCNDAGAHPGPVGAGNLARAVQARLPLIGAYSVEYTMGGCVAWPNPRQALVGVHPGRTPPVMVIGNTGDPNTPLVGAQHLAGDFTSAGLVVWKGWGHTWLLSGSTDRCMQGVVTRYLTTGHLPPKGTRCA